MADEKKPNVLIIDDGTTSRVEKTDMYAEAVEFNGGIVTRAKLQDINNKDQLMGYDLILTDFDGMMPYHKNHPDSEKFLRLLQQAVVENSASPIVRMFSSKYNRPVGHGIDFKELLQSVIDIVSIHNTSETLSTTDDQQVVHKGVIELAMEAVKSRLASAVSVPATPSTPDPADPFAAKRTDWSVPKEGGSSKDPTPPR